MSVERKRFFRFEGGHLKFDVNGYLATDEGKEMVRKVCASAPPVRHADHDAEVAGLRAALVNQCDEARDFPTHTCPASRHVQMMGEALMEHGKYPMLADEPEHCAESLLATVTALWRERKEVAEARRDAEGLRAKLAAVAETVERWEVVLLVGNPDFGHDGMAAQYARGYDTAIGHVIDDTKQALGAGLGVGEINQSKEDA